MGTTDPETAQPSQRIRDRWWAAVFAMVVTAGVVLFATVVASAAELPPGGTFVDDDGSVHEGAIEAIAAAGVTLGCRPEYFCVERLLTRAEMAAFLARAVSLPVTDNDFFVDDTNHLFEREINQLAAAGITQGCASDQFCPDETMSRGQMASFLARAFALAAAEGDAFSDDDGLVHEGAINSIAAAGITTGCADGAFCPLSRVRRDQMASFLSRAMGLDAIWPPPRTPQTCRNDEPVDPTGRLLTVSGGHPKAPATGQLWRYRVEVEEGLGFAPDCLATAIEIVLTDAERGWGADGSRGFERVDAGDVDFIVALASPATTDAYCLPLITGGILSCWNGSRAMLNSWRWQTGAGAYDDVEQYRIYLINHEVGHAIGQPHRSCPAAGAPAPVMMQQTKGIGSCVANPWPTVSER